MIRQLRSRQILLLLDNGEHLLDAVANLVALLRTACPTLQALATTDQPASSGSASAPAFSRVVMAGDGLAAASGISPPLANAGPAPVRPTRIAVDCALASAAPASPSLSAARAARP
ncbi:MAG TPA: hypothetical protein VFU81_15880 [Thermomicrobiales bacterium]|nr:hypothetical protein [Thermomicrobiales bacterium]